MRRYAPAVRYAAETIQAADRGLTVHTLRKKR